MHEYTCAVVSVLILCFFLVLGIFWEEQSAEQFWYFNFSLYLVVFLGGTVKKTTLYKKLSNQNQAKTQGQILAWYACTALLLRGEEDPRSIRLGFPSRQDRFPPRVHQTVVHEDPLREVSHYSVVSEVDLRVVGP